MVDCIFCKIVKGEIPSAKLYEDDNVYAFLDIGPVHKGHSLVIPKKHYEDMFDVPGELLGKQIQAVQRVAAAVKKATGCDGVNIAQSNGKAAGQVVPHIHFHIMPRYLDDGLRMWPQGKYAEGEMEKYRDKIAKAID